MQEDDDMSASVTCQVGVLEGFVHLSFLLNCSCSD